MNYTESGARVEAENQLQFIIKSQPDLLVKLSTGEGAYLADFCNDFIDQYVKRLMNGPDRSE